MTTAPFAESECPILFEMYRTGKCIDPTGKVHEFAGAVSMGYAHALYNLVRREKPRTIVEIGLMRGGSALAMLAALKKNEEEGGGGQTGGGGGGKMGARAPNSSRWTPA
ncbi:MAG: hypothetical protein ACKVS8_09585, partial [Phycisphaerales bacterium]